MLEIIIPSVVAAIGSALGGKKLLDKKNAKAPQGKTLLAQLPDRVLDVLRTEMFTLLHDPDVHQKARRALEFAADSLLDRLSIPRNAAVDFIVDAALDKVTAELAERLWDLSFSKIELALDKTVEKLS